MSSDEECYEQEVTVCRTIQHILEGYPAGTSILFELLQNADDAHATKALSLSLPRYREAGTGEKCQMMSFDASQHSCLACGCFCLVFPPTLTIERLPLASIYNPFDAALLFWG